MTEMRLNIIVNVSESGSHWRCCTTRSKNSFNFNMFISYPLMFLDSIFELFQLTMQGTVTLILPVIPDVMKRVLSFVRESLMEYWKSSTYCVRLGLVGELLPGLSVPIEEHDLQDSEKMGLVRTKNFQLSLDLHHRRPR